MGESGPKSLAPRRRGASLPGCDRGRPRFRVAAVCALALAVSLTPLGGVRPSEAGFVALLVQMKTYLNVAIDQWEKYSRILEDHLDKVTGIMQPFSEMHAGVRELTNVNGLREVYRLADSYRASVSDPRCFVPGFAGNCAFQRDFIPPEVREIDYEFRWGVRQGANAWNYTLEQLEGEVFERSAMDTAQEAVMAALSVYSPAAAAEAAVTQARIERNIERNRWQLRRMRSIANRRTYAARNFVFRADQQAGPGPDRAGCPSIDVETDADATILDQAINADCLESSAHQDDPLNEQAHLSEMEAKTLRAATMVGVVDMAALALEEEVDREAAALESAERAEAQRRERFERFRQRMDCVRTNGSFAYGADGCGTVVSGAETLRRQEAQLVSMLTF